MNGTFTAKGLFTNPYFSGACFFAVLLLLPRYGGVAVLAGCASILTAYVATTPEQFRNQSGSLTTAIGLLAALWAAVAVVAVMALTGAIPG